MAWSNGKIFSAYVTDSLNRTAALDLNSDTFKVALYNNSITPDQTVASANTAYNAGQWATANEVSSGAQWAAGGVALSGITSSFTGNVFTFSASNTASGATATLSNVHGCLIYDDTLTTPVADQGVCYLYFGGAQSVTSGTFTIQWNASGIMQLTL